VAVIRDDARPQIPEGHDLEQSAEYEELMRSCWDKDPAVRPTFLEILTRLGNMAGEAPSGSSSRSTEVSQKFRTVGRRHGRTNSFSAAGSFYNYNKQFTTGDITAVQVLPPMGEVTIVFTDITSAASLWEFDAEAMKDATLTHNQTLRDLLDKYRGYEVRSIKDRNAGEGSFCMAFQDPSDALEWCSEAQNALLNAAWPPSILKHPGAAEEWGGTDDQ
jgi:hypothetical protein